MEGHSRFTAKPGGGKQYSAGHDSRATSSPDSSTTTTKLSLNEYHRARDRARDEFLDQFYTSPDWLERGRQLAGIPAALARLEDMFQRFTAEWDGEGEDLIIESAELCDRVISAADVQSNMDAEQQIAIEDVAEEEEESTWEARPLSDPSISRGNRCGSRLPMIRDLNNNDQVEAVTGGRLVVGNQSFESSLQKIGSDMLMRRPNENSFIPNPIIYFPEHEVTCESHPLHSQSLPSSSTSSPHISHRGPPDVVTVSPAFKPSSWITSHATIPRSSGVGGDEMRAKNAPLTANTTTNTSSSITTPSVQTTSVTSAQSSPFSHLIQWNDLDDDDDEYDDHEVRIGIRESETAEREEKANMQYVGNESVRLRRRKSHSWDPFLRRRRSERMGRGLSQSVPSLRRCQIPLSHIASQVIPEEDEEEEAEDGEEGNVDNDESETARNSGGRCEQLRKEVVRFHPNFGKSLSMFELHRAVPIRVSGPDIKPFRWPPSAVQQGTNRMASGLPVPLNRYSSTESAESDIESSEEYHVDEEYFVTNPAFGGPAEDHHHHPTPKAPHRPGGGNRYRRNQREKIQRSRSLKSLYGLDNCHENPLYDPSQAQISSNSSAMQDREVESQLGKRPQKPRMPPRRKCAVPDKIADDLAIRRTRSRDKMTPSPNPLQSKQLPISSYMAASPIYHSTNDSAMYGSAANLTTRISALSVVSPLSSTRSLLTSQSTSTGYASANSLAKASLEAVADPPVKTFLTTPLACEPDLVRDDMLVRSVTQSSGAQLHQPDPPFGIPRDGHISSKSVTSSHYIHTEIAPDELDEVQHPGHFSKPAEPHTVRDDVAFRKLRHDIHPSTYTSTSDNIRLGTSTKDLSTPERPSSPSIGRTRSSSRDYGHESDLDVHNGSSSTEQDQSGRVRSRSYTRTKNISKGQMRKSVSPFRSVNPKETSLNYLDGFYDPKTGLLRFPADRTLEQLVTQYRANCAFDSDSDGEEVHSPPMNEVDDERCNGDLEGSSNPFKKMLARADSFLDRGTATLQKSDSFIFINGHQGGTLPPSTLSANNDRKSPAPLPPAALTVPEQLERNSWARRHGANVSLVTSQPHNLSQSQSQPNVKSPQITETSMISSSSRNSSQMIRSADANESSSSSSASAPFGSAERGQRVRSIEANRRNILFSDHNEMAMNSIAQMVTSTASHLLRAASPSPSTLLARGNDNKQCLITDL